MIWRTWKIEYLCETLNSTKLPCVQSYLAREVPIVFMKFLKMIAFLGVIFVRHLGIKLSFAHSGSITFILGMSMSLYHDKSTMPTMMPQWSL